MLQEKFLHYIIKSVNFFFFFSFSKSQKEHTNPENFICVDICTGIVTDSSFILCLLSSVLAEDAPTKMSNSWVLYGSPCP